ncbi:MAG: hypothetical protein KA163_05490 [Bacteroidia bacterium]|nr:hypothetical protein [Bacteroidia bacterium]
MTKIRSRGFVKAYISCVGDGATMVVYFYSVFSGRFNTNSGSGFISAPSVSVGRVFYSNKCTAAITN